MDQRLINDLKNFFCEKGQVIVDAFYERLLSKSADLPESFRNTDLALQKERLLEGLNKILELNDEPEELTGYLQTLGVRHISYEVEAVHYQLVNEVLTEVLEKHSSDFPQKIDWQAFSSAITRQMEAGAEDVLRSRAKEALHGA